LGGHQLGIPSLGVEHNLPNGEPPLLHVPISAELVKPGLQHGSQGRVAESGSHSSVFSLNPFKIPTERLGLHHLAQVFVQSLQGNQLALELFIMCRFEGGN
jgi:hypothetical protein